MLHVTLDIDTDSLLSPQRQTLAEVIAEMAAGRMLLSLTNEERTGLRHRVMEISDAEIRMQVQPLVAEALARSMRKTNRWGEPTGEPITLAEAIMDEAQTQLTRTTHDDSFSGQRKRTLVQEIVAKEVERTIRHELAQEMSAAREQVAAAIREEGAKVLTETILRMAQ